jgi:hypothetical protein
MLSGRTLLAAVVLALGTLAVGPRLWPAESLAFAGLSPRTTLEAAQQRYPRSTIVGRHVYVSHADSHHHIYGIDLPDAAQPARIRLFFERAVGERREYPLCDETAAVIRKQYGEPARVQEFTEERARNRRLVWRSAGDELSLLCFRRARR